MDETNESGRETPKPVVEVRWVAFPVVGLGGGWFASFAPDGALIPNGGPTKLWVDAEAMDRLTHAWLEFSYKQMYGEE